MSPEKATKRRNRPDDGVGAKLISPSYHTYLFGAGSRTEILANLSIRALSTTMSGQKTDSARDIPKLSTEVSSSKIKREAKANGGPRCRPQGSIQCQSDVAIGTSRRRVRTN